MTKKSKIILGSIALLLIVCGIVRWYMPVRFLRGVEAEDVAAVTVFNANNGDEFDITDSDNISCIVNAIKQITLKKEYYSSGVDYYYTLTIIGKNGEEIDSFGIQNENFMRKGDAFYRCNEEPGIVAEYIENIEAELFPDYNKDPDFPY